MVILDLLNISEFNSNLFYLIYFLIFWMEFHSALQWVGASFNKHLSAAPALGLWQINQVLGLVSKMPYLTSFLAIYHILNVIPKFVFAFCILYIYLCIWVYIQGVFFNWYPPKKLKYGKPRLGESTLT